MRYFRELAVNRSDVPPATGLLAGLAFGVCVFGLWFSQTLVTTRPLVILTAYSLPLVLLAGGFAGILLGSRNALRFTRFFLGLVLSALLIPLAWTAAYSDFLLPAAGSALCLFYLGSILYGLQGSEDTVLGPPPTRGQLRRRIVALAIIAAAFSAASWIWAGRNGIRLF